MENLKDKRLFYGPRDDMIRAKMFDDLLAADDTPEELRRKSLFRVMVLMVSLDVTETEAKALLISMIVYENMDPVERSRCVDHGEAIRRAWEWRQVRNALPYHGTPVQ